MPDTGRIHGMAGRKIVATVKHHVGVLHQLIEQRGIGTQRDGSHVDRAVQAGDGPGSGCDLRLAYARLGVRDLTLQVGQVNVIVVHQGQPADTGAAQIQRDRGSQAARADQQHAARCDALLAFHTDLVEQDMARIAQQVSVVHQSWEEKSGANSKIGRGTWKCRGRRNWGNAGG